VIDNALDLSADDLLKEARRVVVAAQRALGLLYDGLDDSLVNAAMSIAACRGRILVSGMGKSGIAARKLAATLCSLGVPAQFLHAADALHGDLGAILGADLFVAISVSGATRELLPVVQHAQHLGAVTIAITSSSQAPLASQCDQTLLLPRCDEGAGHLVAPMASTIATIALGDALAMLVATCRGTLRSQMARLHPAGDLGRKLRSVSQIMHSGDRVPLVSASADATRIIAEITQKGFGITGVVDERGKLLGTITDGDVRRHFADLDGQTATEVMMMEPVTLTAADDIGIALDLIRGHRISALYIVHADTGVVEGIVHLQDLLRVGVL